MKGILNLGIAAHIDAGKTTVTEQLLYLASAIRQPGSVDKGTCQTDFMQVEVRRGISVRASAAVFTHKGIKINLIDTPGHADFSGEVERSLRVLDGAVIVVSAVEGVQARTKTVFRALERLGVPVLFFINKTDRQGANVAAVLEQIKNSLTDKLVTITGGDVCEQACDFDDSLLERFLAGGAVSREEADGVIAKNCARRALFPVLWGSARTGEQMPELLDAVCTYLPSLSAERQAELLKLPPSGVVYKVEHDKVMGKICHVRLFAGQIKSRDMVVNQTTGKEEKITQIRAVSGRKYADTGLLAAGDIAALCGLAAAKAGDVLGSGEMVPGALSATTPTIRVRVLAEKEEDYPRLVAAIGELCDEDPLLGALWEASARQLLIHITGMIQLEVLSELLKTRFCLSAEFGEPEVIYKETPKAAGPGFVAYTMPKPCWAVIQFWIEPLAPGSGVVYESRVEPKKIPYRYQHQIEQALPKALEQGPKGWEVTDAKITLVDGEDHPQHTHPLDFIVATPMAVADGLHRIGTTLLEPMQKLTITVGENLGGKVMGEIINMRGSFSPPVAFGGELTITARVPVAASLDFPVRFNALTSGEGVLEAEFDGYKPCGDELGKTTPYRGVNPIDQAKYILYIRNALTQ